MLTFGGWQHASSRLRAAAYVSRLEEAGWDVTWLSRTNPAHGRIRFMIDKRRRALHRMWRILAADVDLLFVHRLFLSPFLLWILRIRGVPFVFDFDDAIYLYPGGERSTVRMIKGAAAVIVSSPELAVFCRAQGVEPVVITTPVDADRIVPALAQRSGPCVVGWLGSPWTAHYLSSVAPALEEVAASVNAEIVVVGGGAFRLPESLPVRYREWSYEAEPALLQEMDIGIMPLSDDEWSRGKGGYKLLLYMAAGLPVVASPVGINTEIVRHGETGYLARDTEEWTMYLHRLCTHAEERKEMGAAGRRLAENHYSRTACFGALQSVLKSCMSK